MHLCVGGSNCKCMYGGHIKLIYEVTFEWRHERVEE